MKMQEARLPSKPTALHQLEMEMFDTNSDSLYPAKHVSIQATVMPSVWAAAPTILTPCSGFLTGREAADLEEKMQFEVSPAILFKTPKHGLWQSHHDHVASLLLLCLDILGTR